MNMEQFEHAIDRFGGDLDTWPAEIRAEVEALAQSDPRVARALGDAARLEGLLAATVRTAPVDAAVLHRIMAGVARDAPADLTVRPTARLMAWAGAAMAAFLLAGFVIGLAMPDTSGDEVYAGLMFGTGTPLVDNVL